MKALTTFEAWYGRDEPPPEVIRLRAGTVELEYEAGDLRYVRAGGRELVRRVYVAVRDVNWNTIPGEMSNLNIDAAEEQFRITFDRYHDNAGIQFRWHATIEGDTDGTIRYTMDGAAESDFRYCRIGFCVLHPIDGMAGSPYRATTPDGEISGRLPEQIAPQVMVNGLEIPMFPSYSRLAIDTPDGGAVDFEFEGELFEMEDQRNWTDSSFKTYCLPIALGYPHAARAGQAFRQTVTIRCNVPGGQYGAAREDGPLTVTLGSASGRRLPRIGFGMASHGGDLTAREADLIARLRPDHLKAELHFNAANWPDEFDRAARAARQIGAALELALFLTDESEAALDALRGKLASAKADISRIIVFHEREAGIGTTSPRWMDLARRHLAPTLPGVPFAGGTNGNFAEVNRQHPDITAMDGVSYTLNPQVHAFDERTLIEAIRAERDTVETARRFCGDLPIIVSSVSLKPPFNQAATEDEAPPDPDELPPPVDARQMSLFAAAWTVGSLGALAAGGASSVTYYETTGWRGLMETEAGSPLPDKFRSFPGMVFPVYRVFEWLATAKNAALQDLTIRDPLLIEGLAFQDGNRVGVLIANLQPRRQAIQLAGLPTDAATIVRLNEQTMLAAVSQDEAFAAWAEALPVEAGSAVHTLEPYETALVDVRSE